jgi:adenine-specific DNA-methyltransferase
MPARTELRWEGKYDAHGKRVLPLRVKLPFQTVETVNESTRDRQTLFRSRPDDHPWRNRLIWGDKKYVLPALLDEFAGKVNLIYIDPPFDTGADFSFTAAVPDAPDDDDAGSLAFTKEPSIIEQKAYRDTWGRGLDSYLQWFYETVTVLHDLLAENGSIYVHLDWHVGHYAKLIMDEVFGLENFRNEIQWYYYNKMPDIRKGVFPRSTDSIFFYVKNKQANYPFHPPTEKRDHAVKQLVRKKVDGRMVNARDETGKVLYQEREDRIVDNVWRLSMLQPADKTQNLLYPTQKPESVLERILRASSNEDDLIFDCFCGSGTTAAVAERLNRRWIACDLGRFAVHTTRKRLLNVETVRPFVVQNLGKYERQLWQSGTFAASAEPLAGAQGLLLKQQQAYIDFMLKLYHAQPLTGRTLLHGVKNGRYVHVGGVDAPVSDGDVRQIAVEFKRAMGTGKGAPHHQRRGPTRLGLRLRGQRGRPPAGRARQPEPALPAHPARRDGQARRRSRRREVLRTGRAGSGGEDQEAGRGFVADEFHHPARRRAGGGAQGGDALVAVDRLLGGGLEPRRRRLS